MVSIKASMMSIMLISFGLLAIDTSAVQHKCCRSYMKSGLSFTTVRGFSVQTVTEICPINAIIFHTTAGKACTDPAKRWVMDYINRLRTKAQKLHTVHTSQALR